IDNEIGILTNPTIVNNEAKTVVGNRSGGVFFSNTVKLAQLHGEPDVTVVARALVCNNAQLRVNTVRFGLATELFDDNGDLRIRGTNHVHLETTKVSVPSGARMVFDGPTGSSAIFFELDSLRMTSVFDITLAPARAVLLPADKPLVFGSISAISESNACLRIESAAIQLTGPNGTTVNGISIGGGKIRNTSQLSIESTNQLTLMGSGSVISLTGQDIRARAQAEILLQAPKVTVAESVVFETGSSFVSVSSAKPLVLTTPEVRTDTLSALALKMGNVTLTFADNRLAIHHRSCDLYVLNDRLVVSGDLQVNGNTTYVTSTITSFTDPLITLGRPNETADNIKHRGIQFWWNDKTGVMGFDVTSQTFYLAETCSNLNDVITVDTYGKLRVASVSADTLTATSLLSVDRITSTGTISLAAPSLNLSTQQIVILPGVPLSSGTNTLFSSGQEWIINNLRVSGNRLAIGSAVLANSINTDLRITGIATTWIDSNLAVTGRVDLGPNSIQSVSGDLVVSSNNVVLNANLKTSEHVQIGAASFRWGSMVNTAGALYMESTVVGLPLDVSISGSLINALWKGALVGLAFGGTGTAGPWVAGGLLFATAQSLTQNADQVSWDNVRRTLCIWTPSASNPGHAIEIGERSSAIAFVAADAAVKFSWFLVRETQNGTVLSLSNNGNGVHINRLGQVYIGPESSVTEGEELDGVHVARNLVAMEKIRWPSDSYIMGKQELILFSPTCIQSAADHVFVGKALFAGGGIHGDSNTLKVDADDEMILSAPGGVLVLGKLSMGRDAVYLEQDRWVNLAGSLHLNPIDAVRLPDNIRLSLGSAGSLYGNGTGLVMESPVTCDSLHVNDQLRIGQARLLPSSEADLVLQTRRFSVDSETMALGSTPLVFLQSRLQETGDTLMIQSAGNITLDSGNVRISGNLIVSGETQFTVSSQTLIDGPMLQLGGFQYLDIVSIRVLGEQTILIEVAGSHRLVESDLIHIENSSSKLDGAYNVQSVVSETAFVIASSVELVTTSSSLGQVRSVLTQNPNKDIGILVNYHCDTARGTAGHARGFFGVDRSDLCWKYFKSATVVDNVVVAGILGDIEASTVMVQSLAVSNVVSAVDFGTNTLSAGRLVATGGSMNGVPIGTSVPAAGTFTSLTAQRLEIQSAQLVPNLNAFALQGKQPADFVARDGSTVLLQDWNAGDCVVTLGNIRLGRLGSTGAGVLFMGQDSSLAVDDQMFTYRNQTLQAPSVRFNHVLQSFDMHGNSIVDASLVDGIVSGCDIVLKSDNVLDVSSGTVVFAPGQISGTAISGGLAQIDILGTPAFVRDGVYTTMFLAHLILRSVDAGDVSGVTVSPDCLVGRRSDGPISSLDPAAIREMLNVIEPSDQAVFDQGALLRQGHASTLGYEGGRMSGLILSSFERVVVPQATEIEVNKHITFVTVTQDSVATLPNGFADGQTKIILLSSITPGQTVTIQGTFLCPSRPLGTVQLVFERAGQSIHLAWDNVLGTWLIINTGCRVK
ncbi:hypothetical protein HK102_001754, partial [Quaeritorhiza haematococci]